MGEWPFASAITSAQRARSARRARWELPFSACSADSSARLAVSQSSTSSATGTDVDVGGTDRTVASAGSEVGDIPTYPRPSQAP